jgi:hypothetical protein
MNVLGGYMAEAMARETGVSKQRGVKSLWRRSAQKRRHVWIGVAVVAIVGLAGLGVWVANNAASVQTLQTGIVGKWVNSQGGELDFYAGGSGYIPPVQDMQAYNFGYYFQDATHMGMTVAGKTMTVRIELAGDKLTWFTADPKVSYVYTRVKSRGD